MIITRTPFRVSFFGGGTDYPDWFRENSGSVLATSIDKYCYISCRKLPPFFDHKHRIVYSRIENIKSISDISHPSVRAIMQWQGVTDGLEIHHDGDLPARSGLGSSSAFTVGLLHALNGMNGKITSKKQLASSAIHIEQKIICENVGSQDQVSVAYGGFNRIDFHRDETFTVEPVIFLEDRKELLETHLLLFFTGFLRIASDVAKSQIANIKLREKELLLIRSMVDEGADILQNPNRPIEDFGKILYEAWQCKRSLSEHVSSEAIDRIFDAAMRAGAIGGKILGAGGGGLLLIFAVPEKQQAIKMALSKLVNVPFKFENSGSRVVLYEPNGF
jgi:D-glycero-alpha-D-manno-heptose-7-phosphate kinase